MFRKLKIISIFLLVSSALLAQEDLSGLWRGYNTQESADTYRSKYDFEIYIKQDGQKIWGRSYAYIDEIYAEMEIIGVWDGQQLSFEEIKIVDSRAKHGMEWCIKKAVVTLHKTGPALRLEGSWSGKTSFSQCTPGKVYLQKIKPKA